MKITNKVFKGAAVVLPLARKFRAGVLPTETEFYKRPLIQTEIKEELEEGEVREDV